jgi:hypothetical protein
MTSSSATHVTTLGSRAYDPWVHIFVQPGCTSLCNLGAHLCATWLHK